MLAAADSSTDNLAEDRAISDTIEDDDIDNMVNDSDDDNDFRQSSKRRVLLGEDWLRSEGEDSEQESDVRSALSVPIFRSRMVVTI